MYKWNVNLSFALVILDKGNQKVVFAGSVELLSKVVWNRDLEPTI